MVQSETGTSLSAMTDSFCLLLPACKELQAAVLRLSEILHENTYFYLLPFASPEANPPSSVQCSLPDAVGFIQAHLILLPSGLKCGGLPTWFLGANHSDRSDHGMCIHC